MFLLCFKLFANLNFFLGYVLNLLMLPCKCFGKTLDHLLKSRKMKPKNNLSKTKTITKPPIVKQKEKNIDKNIKKTNIKFQYEDLENQIKLEIQKNDFSSHFESKIFVEAKNGNEMTNNLEVAPCNPNNGQIKENQEEFIMFTKENCQSNLSNPKEILFKKIENYQNVVEKEEDDPTSLKILPNANLGMKKLERINLYFVSHLFRENNPKFKKSKEIEAKFTYKIENNEDFKKVWRKPNRNKTFKSVKLATIYEDCTY